MKDSLATWFHALFQLTPSSAWRHENAYAVFIGALAFLGLLALVLRRLPLALREPVANAAWSNVVIGLLLLFFRTQQIPFLGMDLWRLVQETAIVIWIFAFAFRYRRLHKAAKLEQKVAAYRSRYLPKAKKTA